MGCKRLGGGAVTRWIANPVEAGSTPALASIFSQNFCGKKTTAGERFWSLGQSSQNSQFMTISGDQRDTWISDYNPKRSYVGHPYAYLPWQPDYAFYAQPFALSYRSCPI